ncbi:prephenate dehydratase [Perlucidibaca piscinae]|uniref:prephenate dehydratase n=1 Tax=Perlucidibaca piscinae TaxID=392589 RepID=UPI0004262F0E|nr:prephenate dehydratase [Perlucidibaca piscinae]
MSESLPSLESLRQEIDRIDSSIQDLINARARCAQQVAEVKRVSQPDATVFYRPEREAQVLQKVMARNTGPLHAEEMARLFREIMSACLALEQPLSIAFLGPNGTFTQTAALKHFGHSVKTVPLNTIDEVFREVTAGAVSYGVVPVENTTEGIVTHTADSFLTSTVRIIGEVELRIHHHLLISEGTQVASISRIYAHQQALAQCRQWLDAHFPKAERVAVSSNAEAARRIKGEWHSAAIAGETAAEIYGLQKRHECIEDNPNNTTRFLILGNEGVAPSGDDKTSIVVALPHNEAGALHHILEPFARRGINLTRIESRPSKTDLWTYVFFIDFEGHRDDPLVQDVMAELSPRMRDVKWLGSYPRAVL